MAMALWIVSGQDSAIRGTLANALVALREAEAYARRLSRRVQTRVVR